MATKASVNKAIRELFQQGVNFATTPKANSKIELLDEIKIAQMCAEHPINPKGIYCAKTGQLVGYRDEKALAMLQAMAEAIAGNAANAPQDNLHIYFDLTAGSAPHWVDTSSKKLDWLQEHDPVGYFVFCLTRGLEHLHQNGPRKSWNDEATRLQFRASQIMAHTLAQSLPMELLHKANDNFRKFFAVANPRSLGWSHDMPHFYANAQAIEWLANEFAEVVQKLAWKHKTNFYTAHHAHVWATLVSNLEDGVSIFTNQRTPRSLNANVAEGLRSLYDIGFNGTRKYKETPMMREFQKQRINALLQQTKPKAEVITTEQIRKQGGNPTNFLAGLGKRNAE